MRFRQAYRGSLSVVSATDDAAADAAWAAATLETTRFFEAVSARQAANQALNRVRPIVRYLMQAVYLLLSC